MADGGSIAGWWIDNEKIYQTVDGTRNGRIKTQLNSNGMAQVGNFDYSIVTDAINAAMASIGGVLMSNGLINGYNIAAIAASANNAYSLANSAMARANAAYDHLPTHRHHIGFSSVSKVCTGSVAGDACAVNVSYDKASAFTDNT